MAKQRSNFGEMLGGKYVRSNGTGDGSSRHSGNSSHSASSDDVAPVWDSQSEGRKKCHQWDCDGQAGEDAEDKEWTLV